MTLVHDWLVGMRGGEKVLEVFCEMFPDAPIVTLLYLPERVSSTIKAHPIKSSLLQYMPWAHSIYRHYLPAFPIVAEMSKVKSDGIVISTSHTVAKAMVKRAGEKPLHICYIHTPMRYAWDRFEDYFGRARVGWLISQCVMKPLIAVLRKYDVKTADRVDVFVANSRFVARRVEQIYGRSAEVIHPPVDISRFTSQVRDPQPWYLMVTALVPYKRIEHAIKACARLKRSLKIVGDGPELKRLKACATHAGAQVDFVGYVDDTQLGQYYARARALLFPGVDDFGMVPVEAIAAGCPVIALKEGGILDSMTEETAVLYEDPTVEGLQNAILECENRKFDENLLRRRAGEFSREEFLLRFVDVLDRAMRARNLTD